MRRDVGVVAAALTPRGKRGELNYGACFDLIDFLCKAGVRGIALMTAAGEYTAFTVEERMRVIHLGAKRSRVPLLAGVGSEDLQTSISLAQEALFAGAIGVLLPPPLLLPYPQPELREYYLQFAEQLGANDRIWIVDAPPLTETTTQELLASGGFAGVVSSGLGVSDDACAIPELVVGLDCAQRTENLARASELTSALRAFQDWKEQFPPLLAIKSALELRGIPMGPDPVPMAAERRELFERFGEWFREWLPVARRAAASA